MTTAKQTSKDYFGYLDRISCDKRITGGLYKMCSRVAQFATVDGWWWTGTIAIACSKIGMGTSTWHKCVQALSDVARWPNGAPVIIGGLRAGDQAPWDDAQINKRTLITFQINWNFSAEDAHGNPLMDADIDPKVDNTKDPKVDQQENKDPKVDQKDPKVDQKDPKVDQKDPKVDRPLHVKTSEKRSQRKDKNASRLEATGRQSVLINEHQEDCETPISQRTETNTEIAGPALQAIVDKNIDTTEDGMTDDQAKEQYEALVASRTVTMTWGLWAYRYNQAGWTPAEAVAAAAQGILPPDVRPEFLRGPKVEGDQNAIRQQLHDDDISSGRLLSSHLDLTGTLAALRKPAPVQQATQLPDMLMVQG